jgi:hypothetical protein
MTEHWLQAGTVLIGAGGGVAAIVRSWLHESHRTRRHNASLATLERVCEQRPSSAAYVADVVRASIEEATVRPLSRSWLSGR